MGQTIGFVKGIEWAISTFIGIMIGWFSKLNEMLGLWLSIPLSIAGTLILTSLITLLFLTIEEKLKKRSNKIKSTDEPSSLERIFSLKSQNYFTSKLIDEDIEVLAGGKIEGSKLKFDGQYGKEFFIGRDGKHFCLNTEDNYWNRDLCQRYNSIYIFHPQRFKKALLYFNVNYIVLAGEIHIKQSGGRIIKINNFSKPYEVDIFDKVAYGENFKYFDMSVEKIKYDQLGKIQINISVVEIDINSI